MTAARIRRDMRADYGDRRGYVCVASKARIDGGDQGPWEQAFFAYPEELTEAVDWLAAEAQAGKCVYRPSSLLAQKQRVPPTVDSNVISFEVDSLPPHGKDFLARVGAEFRQSGRHKHYHIRLFLDQDLAHEDLLHLTRWIMAQCGITGSADSGGKWNPHDMLRPLGTINTKRGVRRPVRIVRHGEEVSLEALRSLLDVSHEPDRITLAPLPKDAQQVDWGTVPGPIRTAYANADAMGRNNSDGEWHVMNLCAEYGLSPELALGIAIEGRNDGHFPARHDDDNMRRQIAKAYGNHTKAGTLGKRATMPKEKAPATANDEGPEGDSDINDITTDVEDLTHAQRAEQSYNHVKFAHLLVDRYAHRIMYVAGMGWYFWNKRRWREGDRGIQVVVNLLEREAARAIREDDEDAKKLVMQMSRSSSMDGILRVAKPFLTREASELDSDPYLLNTPDGTLDLRTLELKPHNPADLITKITRGSYNPDLDIDASLWGTSLAVILEDDDVRGCLARMFGSGLPGEVREHVLPVLHAPGRNGKGTVVETISWVMYDYAVALERNFLMQRGDVHTTGTVDLKGARLAFTAETKKGQRLDESMVKMLTGGDTMKGRKLYKDNVEWEPTHQIVLQTNHLPQVIGAEPAIWDRLKVFPFPRYFAPNERDLGLKFKLREEADVVMTWLVRGWLDYRDHGGLRAPKTVDAATREWEEESNPVRKFVDEMCEVGPQHHELGKDLYREWLHWAESQGLEPGSDKWFYGVLVEMQYPKRRTKNGYQHAGLRLRD